MARPTKALISQSALCHNYQVAQELAPNSNNLAVVKANAYGHGAVVIASILEPLVPAFGVACIEEALELRAGGISKPILLLEGIFSNDEVEIAVTNNFWIMVDNSQQADWVLNANISQPVNVWLKVDTGMHRLGVQPKLVNDIYLALKASVNVCEEIVLATHFSSADDHESSETKNQIKIFNETKTLLQKSLADSEIIPCSLSNSAGLLACPEARLDWNRVGFMLYGNSPLTKDNEASKRLKPVMTLMSAIISIREIAAGQSVGYNQTWTATRTTKIATVAIGYGDGYPRGAKSGTPTLINGQIAPLAGRVSMDMLTIDVTDIKDVDIGDDVFLWGPELPVNEIAKYSDTIGYEALTRMPKRTPSILVD
ncbi:alanine racemase [Thalassotalea psychrophila]|uniref:Alanine racemase n=1 Tax=Thalassotalea psychrophila TaxID=3065647 RepID=A0ABY9TNT5_9GAMM|nr:alanine racemase [Colwelliaceae bacterium SQ149]